MPSRAKCALKAQNAFYESFSRYWTEFVCVCLCWNNQASGKKQSRFLFLIFCAVFLYPATFAVQAQNLTSYPLRGERAEKAEKLNAAVMNQAITEVTGSAAVLEPRKIFELNLAKRDRLLRADEKNFYRERLKQKLLEAKVKYFGWSTNENIQNQNKTVAAMPLQAEAARIRAEISDVLKVYERENYTEIVYYESPEPAIFLYAEFIIVVTSAARNVLTNEELQAAAAHELAHECFAAEMIGAQAANDYELQQKIEYKCDLVGYLALEKIGNNGNSVYRAAYRIEQSEKHFAFKYGLNIVQSKSHPASEHRKEGIKLFAESLKAVNQTARIKQG